MKNRQKNSKKKNRGEKKKKNNGEKTEKQIKKGKEKIERGDEKSREEGITREYETRKVKLFQGNQTVTPKSRPMSQCFSFIHVVLHGIQ